MSGEGGVAVSRHRVHVKVVREILAGGGKACKYHQYQFLRRRCIYNVLCKRFFFRKPVRYARALQYASLNTLVLSDSDL